MRLRRRTARPLRSAVLVPVPGAEPVLAAAGLPPNGMGAAEGMPAHVTILYPFLAADRCAAPGVRRTLEAIATAAAAFDLELARVARFPGVLYLEPDPPEPFVALTRAVHERWPEHPPYDGAYDAVVPHLTAVDGPEPPGVAAALERQLPASARAATLQLMVEEPDGVWRVAAGFPLGGA
jgi:hypothetical protein